MTQPPGAGIWIPWGYSREGSRYLLRYGEPAGLSAAGTSVRVRPQWTISSSA